MLSAYLPESVAKLKGISSRLCDLRKKGMTHSEMSNVGVNHWALTANGADALLCANIMQDVDDTQDDHPIPVPIQPDSSEISPDAERNPDLIAADFAAALDAASEVVDTELPDFSGNPPFCADDGATDAHPDVAQDLIDEACALRLRRPLPREHDALYVLSVLIDILGRDSPAMAYELTRVAAYIEGEDS